MSTRVASSSRCSAARRRRGRSRRARSSASGCGASACSRAMAANDPEAQAASRLSLQALQQLGWTIGHNVRIDYRWGAAMADTHTKICGRAGRARARRHPGLSSTALAPLLEATRTVPIVFAGVADPVAAGFVESLARPGGNATGFTVYEYSIGGKWLDCSRRSRRA